MTSAMARLVPIGRLMFALGLVAFGVMHLLFGDFIAGRAPSWPAAAAGADPGASQLAWAYVSGAALVGSGVAMIAGVKARSAALLAGALIFGWAFLRQIPVAAADPTFGSAWTKLGKGLMLSGGAWAMAASYPALDASDPAARPNRKARTGFIWIGRLVLGVFMIGTGIQHFLWTEFVATLVPGWISGPVFWTYFAGVALIAGGTGLLVPITAVPAALLSGLMVFIWLLILHIPLAVAMDAGRAWISVFEALAVSGLAFYLAGMVAMSSDPARA